VQPSVSCSPFCAIRGCHGQKQVAGALVYSIQAPDGRTEVVVGDVGSGSSAERMQLNMPAPSFEGKEMRGGWLPGSRALHPCESLLALPCIAWAAAALGGPGGLRLSGRPSPSILLGCWQQLQWHRFQQSHPREVQGALEGTLLLGILYDVGQGS